MNVCIPLKSTPTKFYYSQSCALPANQFQDPQLLVLCYKAAFGASSFSTVTAKTSVQSCLQPLLSPCSSLPQPRFLPTEELPKCLQCKHDFETLIEGMVAGGVPGEKQHTQEGLIHSIPVLYLSSEISLLWTHTWKWWPWKMSGLVIWGLIQY